MDTTPFDNKEFTEFVLMNLPIGYIDNVYKAYLLDLRDNKRLADLEYNLKAYNFIDIIKTIDKPLT